MQGDFEDEDEDDLVELPGGIDQLEALIEEHERPDDNSKLVFERHSGSVFCCDLAGGAGLAVTGGEDDKVKNSSSTMLPLDGAVNSCL